MGCDLFPLLLDFLISLLLLIFQIHDGLVGQLQISFQLPLGSLKVHAELLFLLQGSFKLFLNIIVIIVIVVNCLFYWE